MTTRYLAVVSVVDPATLIAEWPIATIAEHEPRGLVTIESADYLSVFRVLTVGLSLSWHDAAAMIKEEP